MILVNNNSDSFLSLLLLLLLLTLPLLEQNLGLSFSVLLGGSRGRSEFQKLFGMVFPWSHHQHSIECLAGSILSLSNDLQVVFDAGNDLLFSFHHLPKPQISGGAVLVLYVDLLVLVVTFNGISTQILNLLVGVQVFQFCSTSEEAASNCCCL